MHILYIIHKLLPTYMVFDFFFHFLLFGRTPSRLTFNRLLHSAPFAPIIPNAWIPTLRRFRHEPSVSVRFTAAVFVVLVIIANTDVTAIAVVFEHSAPVAALGPSPNPVLLQVYRRRMSVMFIRHLLKGIILHHNVARYNLAINNAYLEFLKMIYNMILISINESFSLRIFVSTCFNILYHQIAIQTRSFVITGHTYTLLYSYIWFSATVRGRNGSK